MKLLVVERLLQRAGYRVSCCKIASDALALARAAPDAVDTVVTDFNMPARSGLDLAEALAQVRADLPVVISNGYISEELRTRAEGQGAAPAAETGHDRRTRCPVAPRAGAVTHL